MGRASWLLPKPRDKSMQSLLPCIQGQDSSGLLQSGWGLATTGGRGDPPAGGGGEEPPLAHRQQKSCRSAGGAPRACGRRERARPLRPPAGQAAPVGPGEWKGGYNVTRGRILSNRGGYNVTKGGPGLSRAEGKTRVFNLRGRKGEERDKGGQEG